MSRGRWTTFISGELDVKGFRRRVIDPSIRQVASKYRNVKTNGHDSKKQAKRAKELQLLERGGVIRELRGQVKFILIPTQRIEGVVIEKECSYTADFVYEEKMYGPGNDVEWRIIVEDVKGYPNDRWAIKRKLMLFVHGHRVRET